MQSNNTQLVNADYKETILEDKPPELAYSTVS